MAIDRGYHVKIGDYNYVCKIDSKTPFAREPQQPFITRQSVATSRSEGDYGQDLVFTQTSWTGGEGQVRLTGGAENMYYTSSDMDVSGSSAGLTLLKDTTKITQGASEPDPGSGSIVMEPGFDGIYVLFPTDASVSKELWKYTGSAWSGGAALATGRSGALDNTGQMVMLKGYLWILFGSGIARVEPDGTGFATDFNTTNGWVAIGHDNETLYGSISAAGPGGYYYSNLYSISQTADTQSAASGDLDGVVISIKEHAGTMYAVANIKDGSNTNVEQAILYRYDGTNFVTWKTLPDGFVAQTLRSDGSVLYIGGNQKCAEGNYRGQIYYLTGSAATESLGSLATFGERDGSSDYNVSNIRPHGKSIYFPWMFYGGLGRYDTVNGGVSRSYRQSSQVSESNTISRIGMFKGNLYFTIKGTNTSTDKSCIYKTQDTTFKSSGQLDSSYIDFGLPSTQKLFKSITVIMPVLPEGGAESVHAYYSVDNDTTTWTDLGTFNNNTTYDSDSSEYLKKKTIDINTKASNLSYRMVLASDGETNSAPKISAVSVNAKTLLRSPGKTEPNRMWRFTVVISNRVCKEGGRRIKEQKQDLLDNLRDLHDAQTVTTFESITEKGTSYNAVIAKISETAIGYTDKEGYEGTIDVEVHEV